MKINRDKLEHKLLLRGLITTDDCFKETDKNRLITVIISILKKEEKNNG